jgi:hypothetical protein
MERLTLNILLTFAQFEREVIGERIRDNASKKKGMWMGGIPLLGYRILPQARHSRRRGGDRARHLPSLCVGQEESVILGGIELWDLADKDLLVRFDPYRPAVACIPSTASRPL